MTSVPISDTPLTVQIRVLRALVLRDIRSRFGSGFFSYLVAILIPFGHLIGLMLVPFFADQIAPIGTNYAVFAATGVLPYILFLYPARMMMLCLVDSESLLGFPIVKPLDVVFARAVVETIVAFIVVLLFLLVLRILSIEVWPQDIGEATGAIFSTLYLGVGFGFISALMYRVIRSWLFVQIVVFIAMYGASGAFFLPRQLPEDVRAALWFDPLFHCVEWLRLAYYEGYSDQLLSKQYLLGFATGLLFLGILFERLIRGRLTIR